MSHKFNKYVASTCIYVHKCTCKYVNTSQINMSRQHTWKSINMSHQHVVYTNMRICYTSFVFSSSEYTNCRRFLYIYISHICIYRLSYTYIYITHIHKFAYKYSHTNSTRIVDASTCKYSHTYVYIYTRHTSTHVISKKNCKYVLYICI